MTKAQRVKEHYHLAKIKVVGVGGAGCNAVSRMFGDLPKAVDLVAINTDLQDLNTTQAKRFIQIGKSTTRGLGTGMNPELGRLAAEESRDEISEALKGADMVFITAGEGGGTGSGASPIIAEVSKDLGVLTVAVVTKPFSFEGVKRAQVADEGISRLKAYVDTLIVIPNDRIFSLIDKDTTLAKAFEEIDEVLKSAVLGITELITSPGTINIDFADVKTIVHDGGTAIVGIGIASGPERSVSAANAVMNSPLLETSVDGAKGVLLNISGQRDLTMNEINEIARLISEHVDPSAKIIFGTSYDRKLKKGQIKVTLVATGFNGGFIKNNVLFPSFSQNSLKEVEIEAPLGQKVEEEASPKSIFEKKTELRGGSRKKKEEIWDIPAFLRKKKRR